MKNEFIEPKWTRAFILAAGGILLAGALVRFLIAAGNAPMLSHPEPLLGIPLRYAVLFVGTIELTVSLICLFGKQIGFQIGLLAWLATNFIVYWVGLIWTHTEPRRACWGTLTDPLNLSHGVTGYIVGLIPCYLMLGSYGVCLWFWLSKEAKVARLAEARQRPKQRAVGAGLLKMFCPTCGGHIKFATQNIGQQIPCPHCKAAITLRKPEDAIKMTCVLCGGRVEFPAHALGQKIPCPHCAKTITLKNRLNSI